MNIEYVRLTEIHPSEIIALMNNPLVLKHMPLASSEFNEGDCKRFIEIKEKLWDEHGYGPWGFLSNGKFIGWGGLQPEGVDTEIALILHPKFWGIGRAIYEKIIHYAFDELNLKSVIILFPPSRNRVKGILQLGFERDGELEIEGERFIRYRRSQL